MNTKANSIQKIFIKLYKVKYDSIKPSPNLLFRLCHLKPQAYPQFVFAYHGP